MRLPVRSFFVLFFFFFFLPLVRPLLRVRCSESVKPERGGRFRKERFPSPAESMALCFHAPHPKPGLRPSGHEIPVPHAVSCTVTWTVGPGITNHSVCKSLDHSAFLIAIANEQQANRAYILRPASKPKKKHVEDAHSPFTHHRRCLPMIDKPNHHSLFFAFTTPDLGACRSPSTHSHISLNSPRTNPVMSTDSIHAGLRRSQSR